MEEVGLKTVVDEICKVFADEPQRFRDVLFLAGFPTSQLAGMDTQSLATSFLRACLRQTHGTLARAFEALHEHAPRSEIFAQLAARYTEEQ